MTRLRRVLIKQFRAYEHIEVIFKEDRGVVLMSGDNGSGKSTLLNAICWCLYADTPFFSVEDSDEIVNKHAPENTAVQVQVEAEIDGNTYVFERTAKNPRDARGGMLAVQRETNGNWETLEHASGQDAVNKFLPKEIRHLFIFNGEQIASIFKPDNDRGLRESIKKVSELELIDKARDHLSKVEADLLNEIQKSSKFHAQVDKLKNDRIIKDDQILRKEEEISILQKSIEANEVKSAELDEIAQKTASARETKALRDQLEENLQSIEGTLEELKFTKSETLQQSLYKALLNDDFTDYIVVLEKAEENSLLPPPIKPEVTDKILHSKMCICGREIHEDEIRFIEEQHKKHESADELSYLIGATYTKTIVDRDLDDAWYLLSDTFKQIAAKTKEKEVLQQKIYEYNEILDKVNLTHDNPLARRNEIYHETNQQRSAKTRSEAELEHLKRERRETEEALKRINDKDEDTKELENKRLYVNKIMDQLADLKAEMEESIREKLTESVSEIFFSILPDTVFDEIKIDSSYALTLHARDGRVYMANNLSTGQAKALGLSLAYGLSKDMGYATTPMLIDNLYGDIKDTHFEDVTHMVDALSKSKQVVIMDLNASKSLSLFNDGAVKQVFSMNRIKDEYRTVITEEVL